MSDVTLSASIRANLNSLKTTNEMMAVYQNRLATGKRVNSATDDPLAFYQAKGLSNRAADLSTLKDNIGQAISSLKNATESLDSISKLLDQAKSLATQAKTNSTQVSKITSGLDLSANEADITGIASISATDTFTIKVGDATAKTITISANMTKDQLMSALNSVDSSLKATYDSSTGKISLAADAGKTIVIADGTGTPLADSGLFAAGTTVIGSTGSGSDVSTLQASYKEILAQIDQLKSDASYNGVNLLNGDDMTINFNETGSSNLVVSGVTYDHAGLGLTASASVDWSVAGNIDAEITKIKDALSDVRSQSAKFGNNLSVTQIRSDFTNAMINRLTEGADKLTNADTTEDTAKLLSLSTRQSMGSQALSLASQAEQSILQLFR